MPVKTGEYYIEVDGWYIYTGTYSLSVAESTGASTASVLLADAGDRSAPDDLAASAPELAWQTDYSSSVDGIL